MPVQLTVKTRFERPAYLDGYTQKFIDAYVNELNSSIPSNSSKFTAEFMSIHDSGEDRSGKSRQLPPDYTGAMLGSIGFKFKPINKGAKSQSNVLTVGYLPDRFSGRMRTYVRSIEGGWKAATGGNGNSGFDQRVEQWAEDRLGIKKDNRADRARLWGLKKSIRRGAMGRGVVPQYAQSPVLDSIWQGINQEVFKNLTKRFSGVKKKEIVTNSFTVQM